MDLCISKQPNESAFSRIIVSSLMCIDANIIYLHNIYMYDSMVFTLADLTIGLEHMLAACMCMYSYNPPKELIIHSFIPLTKTLTVGKKESK